MLIEFSAENFRSFRDMQTLHMQAAPFKSKDARLDEQNIIRLGDKLSLVRSKVVYGANASGKSNLVKALSAFLYIFRHSLQDDEVLAALIEPFLLNTKDFSKPSYFQIRFRLEGRNYRYGFEATRTAVQSEWLYSSGDKGPESYHFRRDKQDIEVNARNFKEGARLVIGKDEMPPLYRPNALFLPLVAAFNGPLAAKIARYFSESFAVHSGMDDPATRKFVMDAFQDETMRKKMTEVLKQADLGINDLEMMEVGEDGLPNQAAREYHQKMTEGGRRFVVMVTHRKAVGETGESDIDIPFLLSDESYGTQKLFSLSPFLISALENGGVLVLDEFGSSLHVKLIRAIISLFHSPQTNPLHAQLIVATHDTHLLDQRLFRRDQIAFVEKDRTGQSILTDLAAFKGVRNDASLESDYLQGRYGAIPYTNRLEWAFIFENNEPAQQKNGSK